MIAQDLSSDVLNMAARDVFETMIFMDLQPITDSKRQWSGETLLGSITFNGAAEGCFGFACQQEGATAITQSMLGLGPEDPLSDDDVRDAIGEVANMVMGNLKTLIADVLGDLQISVPTVVRGEHVEHGLGEGAQKLYVNVTLSDQYPAELSFFWRS